MLDNFYEANITLFNYNDKIDYVKSLVRKSKEYKMWLAYIYEQFEYIKSPELQLLDLKDTGVTTEVHHIIFMESIVSMVCMKYLLDHNDTSLTAFQLADMVIQLHFEDKIPCVILPQNIHEMYHDGNYKITINTDGIHLGNAEEFVNEYREYMTDDEINLLQSLGVNTHGQE